MCEKLVYFFHKINQLSNYARDKLFLSILHKEDRDKNDAVTPNFYEITLL